MEDVTNRGSNGREAESGDETSNGRSELDEEDAAVLAGDGKETLDRRAKVLDEVANGRSVVDEVANRASETSETEAAEEAGDVRGKLDQEVASVLADDFEDVIGARGEVLDNLATALVTLKGLAEGVDDFADRLGDAGEEAGEEPLDFGGQLDEEHTAIIADDGEKVLDGLAEVLEQITDVAGGLDDVTNRLADLGKAEAAQQADDRGAKLDKEVLGVLAGDGEGGVDAGGEIREEAT